MREIEDLIKEVDKYKNAIIQKKFKSKKNTVAYVTIDDKPRVLKWFVPGLKKQMMVEYNILKKASPEIPMPSVHDLDEENNVLVLTYISGDNLCDVLNDNKTSEKDKERLMVLTAEWFAKFHTFFRENDQFRIRGDPILHNFLLTDRIWGLDFEESRYGKPVEDIAGLCASVLSTDPMFTDEKFKLCEKFIQSYNGSVKWVLEDINSEIAYSLLEKIQWRPEDEEELRKYSKKIRKHGLH